MAQANGHRWIQILCTTNSHLQLGPSLHCNHRAEWKWQIQYFGCNLLRTRHYQFISSLFHQNSVCNRNTKNKKKIKVRVENLQQLVYKEGQARVTKASVSLVFDNRDPNDSPIGYEEYDEITVTRQVVIGGRNKYMINGQTAQLGRIRDLFHSVQLDVNNPHFLIMQGRITKVLNMKPAEILGMIQEAAGTKMYELKKSQAIKTMNKKQVKVNEIKQILEQEITPQLDKLKNEKTHYLQWYVLLSTLFLSDTSLHPSKGRRIIKKSTNWID